MRLPSQKVYFKRGLPQENRTRKALQIGNVIRYNGQVTFSFSINPKSGLLNFNSLSSLDLKVNESLGKFWQKYQQYREIVM